MLMEKGIGKDLFFLGKMQKKETCSFSNHFLPKASLALLAYKDNRFVFKLPRAPPSNR